ncbi:MAG: hypothetical protein PHE24_06505 [Patescibacteria group bacterium]|nr:hypothetical protein [Patescibacteria group bacterium]
MNNTKLFLAIILLLVLYPFINCSRENPVQVVATDGIYRPPLIANVQLVFDNLAAGGKTITDNNGNDAAVGVRIVKNDQPSIILMSDSWLGAKKSDMVKGVNFEPGWTLKATVVVYKDVGATIGSLIDGLANFPDGLDDAWIQAKDSLIFTLE